MNDLKLLKWVLLVLAIPVGMAMCSGGGEHFRYPCQNPANWEKEMCQMPLCDVTRTCPEHIFKGQNDPRKGPQVAPTEQKNISTPSTGVTCK